MKQKYKESDLKEFYMKHLYCNGMPEYSELTAEDKQTFANTLSFYGYMLGNAVDELKGSIINTYYNAIESFVKSLLSEYKKIAKNHKKS